jgi:hypothetical protein
MTDDVLALDELIRYLSNHFQGVDVSTYPPDAEPTAWFFSRDSETYWPNFATIVTTDEHDLEENSNLTARGAYRLNIGVSRHSFERLIDPTKAYDYASTDALLPHPVYAKQFWISILNPSHATFQDIVVPLLTEAHDRLAAARARHTPS